MAKLTDEQFSAYLAEAKAKLAAELPIAAEKKINYGYQYTVKLAEAKLTLNIYNGKKGLNIVYSGDSALAERAAALLEGRRAQAAAPAIPASGWRRRTGGRPVGRQRRIRQG